LSSLPIHQVTSSLTLLRHIASVLGTPCWLNVSSV